MLNAAAAGMTQSRKNEGGFLLVVIGVTGGIGSGKSTVARILEARGARVIDADRIAREVVRKGSRALDEIAGCFGSGVITRDGELDRKKLAAIVFSDKEKLEALNSIVHKYVVERIEDLVKSIKNEGKCEAIVIDAPIPVEHGFVDLADSIWVVAAEKGLRTGRIIERSGCSFEEAVARIESQMSEAEYIKMADEVLYNNGNLAELEREAAELFAKTCARKGGGCGGN